MESNPRLLEPAPGDPEFCKDSAELVGEGRVEVLEFPWPLELANENEDDDAGVGGDPIELKDDRMFDPVRGS